jgi:prolipoprotein diacylglyceryltransferase
MFCVGYGVIRFTLEFLRADNTPAYWGLTISQVISLIAIAACLPLLRARRAQPQMALPQPKPAA